MCSKLVQTEQGLRAYRRYDVRKGKTPPVGALAAGTNESGATEFYWIDITEDFSPDNQQYHSAFVRNGSGRIEKVSIVLPNDG